MKELHSFNDCHESIFLSSPFGNMFRKVRFEGRKETAKEKLWAVKGKDKEISSILTVNVEQ